VERDVAEIEKGQGGILELVIVTEAADATSGGGNKISDFPTSMDRC